MDYSKKTMKKRRKRIESKGKTMRKEQTFKFPKGEEIKDMVVFKDALYIATSKAVYKVTNIHKKPVKIRNSPCNI